MNTLLLKFWLLLEPATHAPKSLQIYGPLFHRWLPDGESDSIALDTKDSNAKLKVWFDRRGFVESGMIRFDYRRKEVDPQLMPRQALLQGGPLFGLMEINNLSNNELEVVKGDKRGHELYIALGKRVANKLLQPAISRFLSLLKTNYGQYWIPDLEPWDSRRESLGGYFSGGFGGLFVDWSIDGKKWDNFRPDDPSAISTGSLGRDFSDYPSKNDWQELRETAESDYEPTLAALALGSPSIKRSRKRKTCCRRGGDGARNRIKRVSPYKVRREKRPSRFCAGILSTTSEDSVVDTRCIQ